MQPVDESLARLAELAERVPVEDVTIPADRLVRDECGLICRIDGEHEDVERLKVMGICLGRRLHVIKSGDPMIVSVMGTRLGVAARLAGHVFVRKDVEPHCHEAQRAGQA